MALSVYEIFNSIQGESYDSGFPTTFLRLYGCNLKCSFCDTEQEKNVCTRMAVSSVLSAIRALGCNRVCITGGEPLLQKEVYAVIYDLVAVGYSVSVETNGSIVIDEDNYNRSFKYVMDIKCPSSGMSVRNVYDNLGRLKSIDEVKFVMADNDDYEFAKRILRDYPTKAKILFSPVMEQSKSGGLGWFSYFSKALCKKVIADRLWNVRVQVQLHKVLGVE